MALAEALQAISSSYFNATREQYAGHSLAAYIRGDAKQAVADALGEFAVGLDVVGSAGAGKWAEVPWIAVFDPAITTTATEGYYVVYLFHSHLPIVHLSLNQGTTAVRKEFGERAREVLRDRAELMRKRIADLSTAFPVKTISLGSKARLPGGYEAGHAVGVSYNLNSLPSELQLRSDLQAIVRAYRALTYRGGIDASVDDGSEIPEEFGLPPNPTVIETRKYAYHKKIERNRTATRHAKRHHGYRCQACSLNFQERYGELGKSFIEAHHLRAISSLEEGVAVVYDVAKDFAVLCSNCHRMIHRSSDPSDLQGFRKLVEDGRASIEAAVKAGGGTH